MPPKKLLYIIVAIILYVIAVVFSLVVVRKLIDLIVQLVKLFGSGWDPYQLGFFFGYLISDAVLVFIALFLWKYAKRCWMMKEL